MPPPVAITWPDLRARRSRTSRSRARKCASPRSPKISGTDFPSIAAIMSSVSTKQSPSFRARRRPTTDFPAPMKPIRMMFRDSTPSLYPRHPLGPAVHRLDVEAVEELVEPGQERDGDKAPHESRQGRADEEGREDPERMKARGPAEKDRDQNLPLEDIDGPEEEGGPEGEGGGNVQRHQDAENARHDGAEERNDVQHRGQPADQERRGHAEERETDRQADPDREAHEELASHIATDPSQHGLGELEDGCPPPGRDPCQEP